MRTWLCGPDKETQEVAIDVMKPLQPPYHVIFKHAKKVSAGKDGYRIPTLEMALACKFAPMISLMRVDGKDQDAADFIAIVKKNTDIDLEMLKSSAMSSTTAAGRRFSNWSGNSAGEKLEL